MYPVSKVPISNLTLVFERFDPQISEIWAFVTKKYQFSNLNEILSVSYVESADFKSDFCFQKFWNFITSLMRLNYFIFWFYLLN